MQNCNFSGTEIEVAQKNYHYAKYITLNATLLATLEMKIIFSRISKSSCAYLVFINLLMFI